jgi:hypothetical protein
LFGQREKMTKLFGLAFMLVLLTLGTNTERDRLLKYKQVEAYEIRPGILVMPRYSSDGRICEIGIQRLLYSKKGINFDTDLTSEILNKIVDELAPLEERGPRKRGFEEDITDFDGPSATTISEYENVSIQVSASEKAASNSGEMVAVIRWKNRRCE